MEGFIGTICKNLGWGDRWFVVNPIDRSGSLLLGWDRNVTIYQIRNITFSIEVEFEAADSRGKMWAIFIYASNREKIRIE